LIQQRVQAHATAREHTHSAHAALCLSALNSTARHPDRIELVHEKDAGAGRPSLRVFSAQATSLAEERHDDEGIHAHPHASKTGCVDVDERQLCLGGDHTREEGLAGSGRA
jgi:hypothetical protein